MPYIVGLTGGIGSGKSTIAELFQPFDIPIIDADIVARQVVEKGSPLLAQITEHFGKAILTEQGELNRPVLRQIVFKSEQDKRWLNQLLHPTIRETMLSQLQQYNAPYVLWVVPLLIENKLTELCDRILVIDVLTEIQLARATARDNSNTEIIKNIIASQADRATRLSYADDVIENNLPYSENQSYLIQQIQQLDQRYRQLARKKESKK